jgi:hypothetical protein
MCSLRILALSWQRSSSGRPEAVPPLRCSSACARAARRSRTALSLHSGHAPSSARSRFSAFVPPALTSWKRRASCSVGAGRHLRGRKRAHVSARHVTSCSPRPGEGALARACRRPRRASGPGSATARAALAAAAAAALATSAAATAAAPTPRRRRRRPAASPPGSAARPRTAAAPSRRTAPAAARVAPARCRRPPPCGTRWPPAPRGRFASRVTPLARRVRCRVLWRERVIGLRGMPFNA